MREPQALPDNNSRQYYTKIIDRYLISPYTKLYSNAANRVGWQVSQKG
jgi:hypothetical protein